MNRQQKINAYCAEMSDNQKVRILAGLAATERGSSFGFVLIGDRVVCSTCGGNCGQCGDTDILGNEVPASMTALINSISPGPRWYERLSVRDRLADWFAGVIGAKPLTMTDEDAGVPRGEALFRDLEKETWEKE